jgi:gliding motility associated protien GldN
LYFPTFPQGTLRSLASLIFDAVDMNNPDNTDALPVYTDEYCKAIRSKSEVAAFMSITEAMPDLDDYGNVLSYHDVITPFGPEQILSYKIKELWFFDKERSFLDVRIIEMEPIVEYIPKLNLGEDAEELGEDIVGGKPIRKSLGSIRYDELRPFLAKQEAFNIKNNAARISFDDLLTWKRQFASFIVAEQNVYNNRLIHEYLANPRDQIIESDKIKNEIRRMESDLWQF